jgi:hypothetical protein
LNNKFADHEAEAGIADVPDLDLVVGPAVAIEIAGVLIVAVAVVLVRTAKVRAANHVLAASLRTDRKIVVPNPGKNYN